MTLDAAATVAAHAVALGVAVVMVRHRLLEVVGALAEIASQWAKNREVGQQRDKLWETIGPKIDENTREQRAGFERIEQRLGIQDLKIAELQSAVTGALARISALEAKAS